MNGLISLGFAPASTTALSSTLSVSSAGSARVVMRASSASRLVEMYRPSTKGRKMSSAET
jgi:hypothetical protein